MIKKSKCVVCLKVKGKRVCQLNDNALICPRCCAQIRNSNCEGCNYYTQSEQYTKEKAKKIKPFIMRIDPEVEEAVDQALAIVDNGNVSAGEAIISELFKEHSDLHTVQYAMGVVCVTKGQYDEAITYFDKATEIFPYFVEAWFNKGTCYQKTLKVGDMIRAFQKVVALGNPKDDFVGHAKNVINQMEKYFYEDGMTLDTFLKSEEQFKQAFADMHSEKWETALTGFQAVAAVNPTYPQTYGNMGICYGQLGKKAEALAAFDKALELDPDYEPAMLNRAIYSQQKEEESSSLQLKSVEYYKEYPLQNKSYIQHYLEHFKKENEEKEGRD